MTPGSMTTDERREAVLASLAHDQLRPLPPDPSLRFFVKLDIRRPIRRITPCTR